MMQNHLAILSSASQSLSPIRRKLIALSCLIAIFASLVVAVLIFGLDEKPLPIGQPVPRLNLPVLNDEAPAILGTRNGVKQIILFFTIDCPYCQRELLNFEVLFRRYRELADFLAVTLSDPKETLDFLLSRGFTFPTVYDKEEKVRKKYRISVVPALFLIDEQGILRDRRFSAASLDSDEQWVLGFLNEGKSSKMTLGSDGVVLQDKRNNCGPAALKMVFDHYRVPTTLSEIEAEIDLTEKGSSMFALKRIAQQKGLKAEGWRLRFKDLQKVFKPVIIFVNGDHFVVVDSVTEHGEIFLRDPGVGKLKLPVEKILAIWNGETLLFRKE